MQEYLGTRSLSSWEGQTVSGEPGEEPPRCHHRGLCKAWPADSTKFDHQGSERTHSAPGESSVYLGGVRGELGQAL